MKRRVGMALCVALLVSVPSLGSPLDFEDRPAVARWVDHLWALLWSPADDETPAGGENPASVQEIHSESDLGPDADPLG